MNKENHAITLLTIIGIYQMVNPNGLKIISTNIYKLINICLVVLTTILLLMEIFSIFYNIEVTIQSHNGLIDVQKLFYILCTITGNLKIIFIIRNSNSIWNLLDFSHELFLTSYQCRKYCYKHKNCVKLFLRISYFYILMFVITAFLWALIPIFLNSVNSQNNDYVHKINIVNLRYPVTAKIYNDLYLFFYAIEIILLLYITYGLILYDLLLILILPIMSSHIKTISSAFRNLKCSHDEENNGSTFYTNEEIQKNIVSVVLDYQRIYKKCKAFYVMAYPIVLLQMVGGILGMICMPYSIFVCYQKYDTLINLESLTYMSTLSITGMESFLYSYLFQLIFDNNKSMDFNLYCCDWTNMDVKSRKLILLIMRIINSTNNRLKIHVTPLKCIGLPVLAAVIRFSYTVTSVMIKWNLKRFKAQNL